MTGIRGNDRERAAFRAVGVSCRRRVRPSGGWFGPLSTLPFVLLVFGFAGYAWVQVVQMAFSHVRIEQGEFRWSFAGLDNFRAVARDPVALHSIVITVVFVVATVVLSVLLGLVLALLVHRTVVLKSAARLLVIWPAVVAPVVVSVIWLLVLSPNIGLLNKVLETLRLPDQGWLGTETGAMAAIILVDVWHWTPVAFLLIYGALCAIDTELIEAARCDGASEWQLVRFVQVPILRPAIATTAFIRAVMGVKAFDEMYLLTNGGPNQATTLVSLHIRDVFFDQLDLGNGAAFSVVVVVLVICVTIVLVVGRQRLQRRQAVAA